MTSSDRRKMARQLIDRRERERYTYILQMLFIDSDVVPAGYQSTLLGSMSLPLPAEKMTDMEAADPWKGVSDMFTQGNWDDVGISRAEFERCAWPMCQRSPGGGDAEGKALASRVWPKESPDSKPINIVDLQYLSLYCGMECYIKSRKLRKNLPVDPPTNPFADEALRKLLDSLGVRTAFDYIPDVLHEAVKPPAAPVTPAVPVALVKQLDENAEQLSIDGIRIVRKQKTKRVRICTNLEYNEPEPKLKKNEVEVTEIKRLELDVGNEPMSLWSSMTGGELDEIFERA